MNKLCLLFSFVLFSLFAAAQQEDIIGKWQNPSGEGRIEIYKKGDKYFGKLYWLKEPDDEKGQPKKDVQNPDNKLRNRTIQGLEILTDFDKTGQNTWENGKIYDPKSGKTYSCKMTLRSVNELAIRGFVGVSLLGRTETWKRVN